MYPSTNLVSLTNEDLKDSNKVNQAIKKADLDLLDKINKLSDRIDSLSNNLGLTNTGIQTRYYAFYYPSVQNIPNTGVETLINYGNKISDDQNCVTIGASWKYTALVAGFYQIIYSHYIAASGNITAGDTGIYKNGSKYLNAQPVIGSTIPSGTFFTQLGSSIIQLIAGDYISIYMSSSGGIAQIQSSSNPYVSKIEIIKL